MNSKNISLQMRKSVLNAIFVKLFEFKWIVDDKREKGKSLPLMYSSTTEGCWR